VLIHGDSVDLLLWCLGESIPVAKLWLLYPNPWPKAVHLKRRWHGHGLFPQLLALASTLELRTNWPIYAQEFALAATLCGRAAGCEEHMEAEDLSRFEAKYRASGHALSRVVVPELTRTSP